MILETIEAVIDFITLRRLWKKNPAVIESEMKSAYAESTEAKQLDALAIAAGKKEPIQPPQTTTGSSAPDRV